MAIHRISKTWRDDRVMREIIYPDETLNVFVASHEELIDVALSDDWPKGYLATMNQFCVQVRHHHEALEGALAGKRVFQRRILGQDLE